MIHMFGKSRAIESHPERDQAALLARASVLAEQLQEASDELAEVVHALQGADHDIAQTP